MPQHTAGFQSIADIGRGLLLIGLLSTTALAEPVPFECVVLPDEDVASIRMTNSLDADASCIVSCKFETTKSNNTPQISCAKPVPAGKRVEMCRLTAVGDKLIGLVEGHAECTR